MEEDFEFEDKQELEDGIDNEKHWKSLGIASAVISVICFVIIMAIFILTPSRNSGQRTEPYTLTEVLSKKIMQAHRFNGTWISAHEFIYSSDDKNIMLYDCQNGQSRPITTKLNTTNGEIVHFEISSSRLYMLIVTKKFNSAKRENLECDPSMDYYIYRLDNENMINLQEEFISKLKLLLTQQQKNNSNNGKDSKRLSSNSVEGKHQIPPLSSSSSSCIIQSSQWNPMGNILLIMHDNDIYWLNMESSMAPLRRITMDGSISDSIYNGFNDNIYRDFIFEKPTSLWWSPSANGYYHLSYLQLNNSQVPLSNIVIYDDNGGYSTNNYRYSTINSSIGIVNLWIIRINAQTNEYEKAMRVQPPYKLEQWPHYVVHVNWLSNDQLIVLWSLRDQKRTILGSCLERNNWKCEELVTLRNWLRINHVPNSIMPASTESSLNTEFSSELFFCGQTPENGMKTFYQLYSFNVKTKVINSYLNVAERYTEQRQHYQIIELLGYNNHSKSVFFVGQSLNQSSYGDEEKIISEQDMRINLFVFNLEHNLVHCITCQLVKCYEAKHRNNQSVCIDLANSATINENDADEESCIFQRVYFSPSSEYAIVTCLVGIVPKIYLVKFGDLDQLDLIENIMLFDDNSELETRVQSKIMPNIENFIFTRESDNLIKYLRIKLLTPTDFDHEEIGKYSLLLEMYPSRYRYHYLPKATINNQGTFYKRIYPDLEWAVHMVTEHDFIYAWLDGQFYQDSNHSLHELSFEELLEDYSTLIDFIVTNMTFVNIAQTCLIGNNIGGYFVLNSLSTSSIECGIAISPFTDWNTINSFLAEQYIDMEKVRSNDLQYLLKMTLNWKMLENKNLLIIHGTSNEMFPISQSMRLIKSLTLEEQNRYIKFHQNPANNDMDEMNWTSHHFMELYVDHGNSFDTIIEHFYRKIEFFLFQWIIV